MVDPDTLGQRVDVVSFSLQREVQMRSGGQAAGTDSPDNLAQGHPFARVQPRRDFGQVAIDALHALGMRQPHAAPQFPAPSGELDPAIRYRLNRSAVFGSQIDADMRPVLMQNRMVAMEGEA